jgi:hypothetical protein
LKESNKRVNISSSLRKAVDFSPQACHLEWGGAAVFVSEFQKALIRMAVGRLSSNLALSELQSHLCFATCRCTDVKSVGHNSKLLLRSPGWIAPPWRGSMGSAWGIPEMSHWSSERAQSCQARQNALKVKAQGSGWFCTTLPHISLS